MNVSAIVVRSRYSTELSLYAKQITLPRFMGEIARRVLFTVKLSSFFSSTMFYDVVNTYRKKPKEITHPRL